MSTHERLHPTILREYDIRGIVGETLTLSGYAVNRPRLRHDGQERSAGGRWLSATTGG